MKVIILGSTGSIGTQTLEVIDSLAGRYDEIEVVGLTGNKNIDLLAEQTLKYHPQTVVVPDEEAALRFKKKIGFTEDEKWHIRILIRPEGLTEIVSGEGELVVNALVGNIGLLPTLKAIESGKNIALANKETLVTAGGLINEKIIKHEVKLLPIDSEHSAILQCLAGNENNKIKNIYLTASGGPFRQRKSIEDVTISEALSHPNWTMGKKITIDSATLMNKGLEVIEAKWLFGVEASQIKVLVHPQSIIHSMVEFEDGAVMAQLGMPDMKIPIQYALTYPRRIQSDYPGLNFFEKSNLTFEKPDTERFICLKLAYDAIETGGTMPAVMNAANEVAVDLFLTGKIKFTEIGTSVEKTMLAYKNLIKHKYNVDDITEACNWAQKYIASVVDFIVIVFSFLFVDIFDTIGTLIGVSEKAGFLNKEGKLPKVKEALLSDAIGTTFGALVGTSTVTTYVESAAGVAEGGRTGLTSVVTAILFVVALIFSPIFGAIPSFATAPALIIVGLFMVESIVKIDFKDYTEGLPAFITIIMMPMSYSISNGLVFEMENVMRALISVYDKAGITEFAKKLEILGVQIISTRGTFSVLESAGIKVTEVSEITGFPECLEGRVKTLHPKIHAGILARRDATEHMDFLSENSIDTIDIVVVNLYPFKQTILREDATLAEAIENIDIGGPTMLRSAAKNYGDVSVIVDPDDYPAVLEELKINGKVSIETNFRLAAKVFIHTSHYDALIAGYLKNKAEIADFPQTLTLTYEKVQDLRYGENPHQTAAFYKEIGNVGGCMTGIKQLHGMELSFNNINDAHGALELMKEFDEPTFIACKHANPCGVGSADNIYDAFMKAYSADPVSIFGGVLIANREIDEPTAQEINKISLVEIVLAPSFDEKALEILMKKKNIRLLTLEGISDKRSKNEVDIKKVSGGLLIQKIDIGVYDDCDLKFVTERRPNEKELVDLLFSMKIVKHTKSNSIVIGKDKQSVGIGIGQMNRISACRQAIGFGEAYLGQSFLKSAVLASDAFFPFPDCVEAANEAGITAIVQPGGSKKDQASIDACNKFGMAMVFTGKRHFRH
ncbi:bifunctional purine biosynthesis protein purh [Holotrichia oblita]|nr:bifunctional purine biosynthesis protein purh [Holotrichia oblita]